MSGGALSLFAEVERFFTRYVRCLDEQRYQQWLDLFADDCFYGVIRYEDHKKQSDFFIVGESKDKLRVRLKLGNDTDARMRVHLISAIGIDDERKDGATVSANFAVFCDDGLLYSGRYRIDLLHDGEHSQKIKRCVAVIANNQPNELFYLPI